MIIDHHIFALLAAFAVCMALRNVYLAWLGRTNGPAPLRGHVLTRTRPWASIELYAPLPAHTVWRATICRKGMQSGDLVLAPGAPLFAYRVQTINYIGRHACTAELVALRPRELINSGSLRDPAVREALVLAVH